MSTINIAEKEEQLVRFFLGVYLTSTGNESELAALLGGDDRAVARGYLSEFRSRYASASSTDIDAGVRDWVHQLIERQSQVQSPLGALNGLASREGVWRVPHGTYSLLKTDSNPYGGALHLPSSLVAVFYHQGVMPRSLDGMAAPASLVPCGDNALLAGDVDVPVELLASTTAWCHATGIPASGDLIVKTLKAAASCEPSIQHQSDENQVKSLLTAVSLKHGGRPQDYGLFLQECSLSNPQDGVADGLACLEELCMRKETAQASLGGGIDLAERMASTIRETELRYREEWVHDLHATAMVLVHGDEAWRTAEDTPEVARARAAIERASVQAYHELGAEVLAPNQRSLETLRLSEAIQAKVGESGWRITDTASVHIDELSYRLKVWHDAVLSCCGRGARRGRSSSSAGADSLQLFATNLPHEALTHIAASVYEHAMRWGPGLFSAMKASAGSDVSPSQASVERDSRIRAMQASILGEPGIQRIQDVDSLSKGRGR